MKGWCVLLVGFISVQLNAAECFVSDWYISKQTNKELWAGDMQSARDSWTKETEWQFGVAKRFVHPKGSLFFISELTANETYVQGITVVGNASVRLNGVNLKPFKKKTSFYALNLQQGINTLELKVEQAESKGKNRGYTRVLINTIDLEYIYTPIAKKLEDTRLAVEFLGEMHESYPAKVFLKQIDDITQLKPDKKKDEQIEKLRYEALVIRNPVIAFDSLIFRSSRSAKMPSNWQGNSTYLRKAGKEMTPNFDDEIQILNLKDSSMKRIYDPKDTKEGLMDICLDYSGEKFLYSGVDTKNNTFQVYEMNIDGSGKHQITPDLPEIDHYNGIYLANGKILFCSTASLNSVPCVRGNDYVGTLFEINSDGTGMHQLSFDQENDWYPWVKENGRIMYHRWEYTDNSHYFTRILLEMNPDGTNNRSIYGSNSYWPNTLFYAKQIPGHTSKFSAIVSGHHGTARAGELVLFDQSKGDFEADGALRRIPGRGKKIKPVIIDQYMSGKWPRFLHPYPLSENFFLVSGQISPNTKWGLYLVDTFDNVVKLADADKHLFEPIPVMERTIPPVMPERRNMEAEDATLYIQDIYAGPGLDGIKRGTVKALRIFTYGYAYRLSGSHDALSIEGEWDTKRVLGTVPVEKDGSVMVKIPHSLPLSMQPIDEKGNALQVMRSWTAAQPGEVVSCIGCHESSRMAPTGRPAIASRKAPQKLTSWSELGKPYGFGFKREIQPILDTYCVGCHDVSKSISEDGHAMPNFKDTEEVEFNRGAHFGKSYMALHPYVRRPGPESDLHILTPMDYHTSTSELFQMLAKGHNGVEVDNESMRQLSLWVDLNVPYHATWTEVKSDEQTLAIAERTIEYKKKYSNIDDDIEWMPPMPTTRPSFVKPKKVKRPVAISIDGWPLKNISAGKKHKTVSFNGLSLSFIKIPKGKFIMGSVTGAEDEYPQAVVEIKRPFWMSTTEVTNAQLRAFKPLHDSKYIDQQWKDHVYAGYPANKDEMPAVRVTWNEAMAFSRWLSGKIDKNVTLPTEAQWEWAARAGSDRPFFFGSTGYENYANLADKNIAFLAVSGVNPQPVPERSRSPLNDFVPRDMSFDD
ncbi:MAG: SUMF1/EgtB/PvdO family nonheme iron enzyme, partial [Planctomycetes bacterium]|nr:SUMF1/EgtB/PvdO family nonheme iron enzyme [Planctomycetota bacterium]